MLTISMLLIIALAMTAEDVEHKPTVPHLVQGLCLVQLVV